MVAKLNCCLLTNISKLHELCTVGSELPFKYE